MIFSQLNFAQMTHDINEGSILSNTKSPCIGGHSKLRVRNTDPPKKQQFVNVAQEEHLHSVTLELTGARHWTVEVLRKFHEQPLCSAPCEWLSVSGRLVSTRPLFN